MNKEIQEYIRKDKETLETPSKQTNYYLSRFKSIDETPRMNKGIGNFKSNFRLLIRRWNWSAAFGSCVWMLYRRMYWEAILSLAIIMLLGELSTYIFDRDPVNYAAFYLFGEQGNSLYYAHVKRALKKGKSRSGVDFISPTILVCLILAIGSYTLWGDKIF